MYNEALILIENLCLTIANKTFAQLGLTAPNRSVMDIWESDLQRESQYNIQELKDFFLTNLPKLVEEQRVVYNTIIRAIDNKIAKIRSRNKFVLAIASSGIAATLLDGGRTAHSALKLPLNLHVTETPTCNITENSGMGKILQTCQLIIWYECTMAHKKALEALDRTLQDLREKSSPFGGALILLSGDFRQTLPVIPRSTPADELNACLKSSNLWKNVKTLRLKKNMRVQLQNDTSAELFTQQLLDIGNGKMVTHTSTQLITMPPIFCTTTASRNQLIQKVFPHLTQNYTSHKWLSERAILAATNNDVHIINYSIQNEIPGKPTTYKSIDTVMNQDEVVHYPTEFLNSLDLTGMSRHDLTLKIGVPIILLRNINPPRLCNGTKLAVKKLMKNIIETTILNVCGIDSENPCFSHGQLYVACSRVGKPSDLFRFIPNGKTKNIVYPQALL
ncbi:hypothetical protein TKK_0011580 [Trichogramma kaykai]